MCGIFGIFSYNNAPPDRSVIDTMATRTIHRGPDEQGTYVNTDFAAGMCRLSIVDISGGSQPMSTEDGRFTIIYNGELYNTDYLRQLLVEQGVYPHSSSDTEVVLLLYSVFGTDMLPLLNGMFAFAIYDNVNTSLILARDQYGIKPLYWTLQDGILYFASDLSALKIALPVPPTVSSLSIVQLLSYSYIPGPNTIFSGVHKLPPSSYLQAFKNTAPVITPFVQVSVPTEQQPASFSLALTDSIKRQLISDVPVGILLSGGIDSSLITAIASRFSKCTTFTLSSTDTTDSDTSSAQKVSDLFHTTHHPIVTSPEIQYHALIDLLPLIDEPILDNALISTYMLSRYARSHGFKVLLSGAGADELFAGYYRYLHRPHSNLSKYLVNAIPLSIASRLTPFLQKILAPTLYYFSSISGIPTSSIRQLFRSSHLTHTVFADMSARYSAYKSLPQLDIASYLVDNILALSDKYSMACSLEIRVPYLDAVLEAFSKSSIRKHKTIRGSLKYHLTALANDTIGPWISKRPKQGFNVNTKDFVTSNLSKITSDLCYNLHPQLLSCTDQTYLSSILHRPPKDRDCELIYGLFLLNKWLNIHCT